MAFETIWNEIIENKPNSMTMDEYKNYILGFVFYRYLCINQEEYLTEQNILDVNPDESVNDAFCREAVEDELTDYLVDISSALGYAIEPNETWETLLNKINNETIQPVDFQNLFENFKKNIKLNPEMGQKFNGIFDDVNIGDTRLGNDTNSRAKTLCEIMKYVDEMSDVETPEELFRKLLEHFAGCAGKVGGKFYTPKSVSVILAKIVTSNLKTLERTFTVYDPACGSGSTMLELIKTVPDGNRQGTIKFFGGEKELTTYNLARMNLFINGVSSGNVFLKNTDTLGDDWPDGKDSRGIDCPRKVDAVVSDIEFSTKWNNSAQRINDPRFKDFGKLAPKTKADYSFLLHGLYHLDEEGTLAMVVPHGVLYRDKAEACIRKSLISHSTGNKIYAVIGLPENIMFSEKGKKAVPVAIIVLKKTRETDDILFIDASRDFEKGKNKNYLKKEHIEKILDAYNSREKIPNYAYLASMEEIIENKYNLSISRYVNTIEEEEEIDLSELYMLLKKDDEELSVLKSKVYKTLKNLGFAPEEDE